MKHLKYFENQQIVPKVGDYVILKTNDYNNDEFNYFCSQNVGQIIEITSGGFPYLIKFDSIPPYNNTSTFNSTVANIAGKSDKLSFAKGEIVDISSSKEELEAKIQSKKYNL